MNSETFWILAPVLALVILTVVQTIRQHGTQDKMKQSYNNYRMGIPRFTFSSKHFSAAVSSRASV
jgi:hypothetical protein